MQLASKPAGRTAFENVINSLEAQTANIGAHLTLDSSARLAYTREIKRMADRLRDQASRQRITWAQAAPGAPVCVAVGAFAGGALAAFGVTSLW